MARDFPESDWKVFRRLHGVALERFCAGVLNEIQAAASKEDRSSHDRYLDVYRLIHQRDRELAQAFNDFRRSTAFMQLVVMQSHGLLTQEEMSAFTLQTRESVGSLVSEMQRPSRRRT